MEEQRSSTSANAGNSYQTDPSALTTQQILREVGALKEFVLSRIEGIEKAVQIAHDDLERVPTDVDRAVGCLKELHTEKFTGVEREFADMEKAVQVALSAQEKAFTKQSEYFTITINKSEASINKQIDNFDKVVGDLKDRLTRIEGQTVGRKDTIGYIVGAIGLIATILGIITFFVVHNATDTI